MLKSSSYANNPHVLRASAMRQLFSLVYNARSEGEWGVEQRNRGLETKYMDSQDMLLPKNEGLTRLCFESTFYCETDIPLYEVPSSCDIEAAVRARPWPGFDPKKQFHANGSYCSNGIGNTANYDMCGIYRYGKYGDHQHVSHVNGKMWSAHRVRHAPELEWIWE